MYKEKQTTMLNKFHVWFPGGIVIGSLLSGVVMEGMGWQMKIGVMLIPTLAYAYLIWGQKFPTVDKVVGNTATNIKSLANPLFIFMAICMTLTAATEFSTTQWVEKILGASGASPMIILALVTGLMAVGRYFAGPIIHRLNPAGVLLASAVIAALGVYMFSVVSGPMVYVAAITFAIGICYFWPTMIGFTGEYLPKTGALGMSLVGGAGMFSMSIWNPIIGGWLDDANARAVATGATGNEAEIVAGQEVLGTLSIIPMILIVLFAGLYFYMRGRSKPADEMMATPG
jgi:MFS family permease